MDTISKAFVNFKQVIKVSLQNIGPESKIIEVDGKKYNFADNIFFNSTYFNGGYIIKNYVLDNIPEFQGKVSSPSGTVLFKDICEYIYSKIKSRNNMIENTLDIYLEEDDYLSAFSRLKELVTASYNKYKVFLITNLITLNDIPSVQIGKVLIRKIDEEFIKDLPEKTESTKGLLRILEGNVSTPTEFLEQYKNLVSFELDIEGYHLDKEESKVYDLSLFEYKQTFSYLFMCEHYLSNTKENKYVVETKNMEGMFSSLQPKGLQTYFIKAASDTKYLKMIEAWGKENISNRIIIIDSKLEEALKERCCLEKFNEICQNSDYGEIKHKIILSLDWFLKAMLETDNTNMVISLFISLETLLATGSDYLTSHTDDMAENIAIMLTPVADERYRYKKEFKTIVYPLRNKIMHHGKPINWKKDLYAIQLLKIILVWSIIGIMQRIDEITKYGKNNNAIREYFEREKLK